MNTKYLIRFFVMLLMMLPFAYGVDYNNITFTNHEYLGSAIVTNVVKQINDTHVVVGYKTTNDAKAKICPIENLSNCGTEKVLMGTGGTENMDIVIDEAGAQIIFISGGINGYIKSYSYDLGTVNWGSSIFNTGATNYVSAVQTNSTHFAIGFQDTADSSKAKLIICRLDGASCGSEIEAYSTGATYIKIIKTTTDKIMYAHNIVSNGEGTLWQFNLDGTGKSYKGAFNTGGTSYIDMIEGSDNKLKIVYRDGADNNGKFQSCDSDGTNCGGEITYSSLNWVFNSLVETNNKLFVAGREAGGSNTGQIYNFNLTGGEISNVSDYVSLGDANYNDMIVSSNNQLIIAFDDNNFNSGYFAISEPLTVGATITINYPVTGTYYNTTGFTLNVTTDLTTNLTYSLNGAGNLTMCNNCNSSQNISITAVEGLNNLTVYSNYSGEISSDTISFTVDTTNPSLTVTLPTEYNYYTAFNFSEYITYSDTNIDTCTVTISGESSTTCGEQNYNFTTNGNKTINITATDLAGNTNSSLSNIMLVNPYQRFYFNDGGLLSNYSFGGTTFTGTQANFTTYNDVLTLGTNNLEFVKSGYITQSFAIDINTTSELNQTFNVSQAQITINTLDKVTGNPITGTNFTLEFIATVGLTTYTNGNSQTNITNLFFQDENYRLVVSHTNYETESIFFDFTNKELIEIDVYLTEANYSKSGYVVVKAVDRFSQPIEDIVVKALQWDSSTSSYIDVSQDKTNELGEGTVNIILDDKLYKFRAIYNGQLFDSIDQIVSTADNGKTVTIIVSSITTEETYLLENVIFDISESYNNLTTTSTINVSWEDTADIEQTVCIHSFRIVGVIETKLSNDTANCLTADSSSIERNFLINSTQNIILKVQVKLGDDYITIEEFTYYSTTHISTLLENNSLNYFILTLLNIIAIGLGLHMQNVYIGSLLLMVSAIVSITLVPTVITGGIVAFFLFVGIITIVGAQK